MRRLPAGWRRFPGEGRAGPPAAAAAAEREAGRSPGPGPWCPARLVHPRSGGRYEPPVGGRGRGARGPAAAPKVRCQRRPGQRGHRGRRATPAARRLRRRRGAGGSAHCKEVLPRRVPAAGATGPWPLLVQPRRAGPPLVTLPSAGRQRQGSCQVRGEVSHQSRPRRRRL